MPLHPTSRKQPDDDALGEGFSMGLKVNKQKT